MKGKVVYMRSILIKGIPIVAIALFICIMLSGSYLKKSFGNDDNVTKHFDEIVKDVDNLDWDEAEEEIESLDKAWKKVIKRIQFSAERDEINYLSTNIARLRGAIMAEDRSNALIELNEAYNHFEHLGN